MFTKTHIVPNGHVCILTKDEQFYQLLEAGTHKISKFIDKTCNIPLNDHKMSCYVTFNSKNWLHTDERVYGLVDIEYDIVDAYMLLIANSYWDTDIPKIVASQIERQIGLLTFEESKNIDKEYCLNNEEYKMLIAGLESYGLRIKATVVKLTHEEPADYYARKNTIKDYMTDSFRL